MKSGGSFLRDELHRKPGAARALVGVSLARCDTVIFRAELQSATFQAGCPLPGHLRTAVLGQPPTQLLMVLLCGLNNFQLCPLAAVPSTIWAHDILQSAPALAVGILTMTARSYLDLSILVCPHEKSR